MKETIPSCLYKNSHLSADYNINNYKLEELPISEILELKKSIQNELFRLGDILKNEYQVTMDTSLFTSDGFPRNDIDITGITYVRNRIIILRNDFEKIMQSIEISLKRHFDSEKPHLNKADNYQDGMQNSKLEQVPHSDSDYIVPFVFVQDVLPRSPAFNASFQVGDKIVKFGQLNYENTEAIKSKNGKVMEIGKYIKKFEEQEISVTVNRGKQYIDLTLVPSTNWDGMGLLGCKLAQI